MDILQNSRITKTPIISVLLMLFTRSGQIEAEDRYLNPGITDVFIPGMTDVKDLMLKFLRIAFILLVIYFISVSSLHAQKKSDIGFFAGTSYYLGDINPSTHFYSPKIALGPLYRYNFNPRNSLRLTGIYHGLSADARDFSNPLLIADESRFSGTYIDLASMYEFNFINYQTAKRRMPYTLYMTGGLGYHLVLGSTVPSNGHFTIPFGLGFKFNAGKKLSAGIELSVRKTFYDFIDGVENRMPDNNQPLFGNKDWYNFAGLFFTYKIFNYRDDCPTYD